jgi:hypothetical protein
MGHRVAELMWAAEHARTVKERESAALECESLILRLWDRRTSWPTGWPPASTMKVLDRLALPEDSEQPGFFFRRVEADASKRTWVETFPELVQLQTDEQEIWTDAALAEIDSDKLQDWLVEAGGQMATEERSSLERLVRRVEAARQGTARASRRDRRAAGDREVVKDESPIALLAQVSDARDRLITRVSAKRPRRGAKIDGESERR